MPKTSYQYGTSARKFETEYPTRIAKKNTTAKKAEDSKVEKKSYAKKRIEKQRTQKAKERKNKLLQVVSVLIVFGMLLALSYREIAIMEMFNQKKNLENQLAVIQKENGQVEKSIKEVESTLDWNKIQQIASEKLGMQAKVATAIDLEKADNVETTHKFIKEEETNFIENIISFLIKKF